MCDNSNRSNTKPPTVPQIIHPQQSTRQRRPAAAESAPIRIPRPVVSKSYYSQTPTTPSPHLFSLQHWVELNTSSHCNPIESESIAMNGTCVLNQANTHPCNFEPFEMIDNSNGLSTTNHILQQSNNIASNGSNSNHTSETYRAALATSNSVDAISTMVRNIAASNQLSVSPSNPSFVPQPSTSPSTPSYMLGPKVTSSTFGTMTASTMTTTTTSHHRTVNTLHPHHIDMYEIHNNNLQHQNQYNQHQPNNNNNNNQMHGSPPTSVYQQKYRHFFVPLSVLNLPGSPITAANLVRSRATPNPVSTKNGNHPRVHQRSASSSSACNSTSRDTAPPSDVSTHTTTTMMSNSPISSSFIHPSSQNRSSNRMDSTTASGTANNNNNTNNLHSSHLNGRSTFD
ncbi:hypothetical protein RDWZM_001600, partial [Blomia tropicalis]